MAVHILGIRHHGPGSARGVKAFLEQVKPDIVLVEGPPEADAILEWVGHPELQPPVAILCYQPDNPRNSVFYPFAEFSPEWQAILYAKTNHIHVRFMDLPISQQFALEPPPAPADGTSSPENPAEADAVPMIPAENPVTPAENPADTAPLTPSEAAGPAEPAVAPSPYRSPTSWLAQAAGFDDEEKWWEHMFEHRLGPEPVFEAVNEAMMALREAFSEKEDLREKCREAHMRRSIRLAEKEMFQNIAVICGAWHAPALGNMPPAKQDNDLLKGLAKVKTECTWIPWTYQRLSFASGYGAGILSPGWYDHIWHYPADEGIRWMAKVAAQFREKNMDTSAAHVMEAVRLARSLASLRQLPRLGLQELNEAALSILCHGEPLMMELVREKLIVSDRIGATPSEIPKPPLQLDIEKQQKRLRLPPTAEWKDYTLDLRKDTDLERSILLHRLSLLEIRWGQRSEASGKGTFKEQWRLQWDPSFSIDIIEKGTYGNTIAEAAEKFAIEKAKDSGSLKAVSALLSETLPAELHAASDVLIDQINNLAAASGDVIQLMEVMPELVAISRYGNVRKTDVVLVQGIVRSMITRICISLPAACTGIDEEAASRLADLFVAMNDAVNLLQEQELTGIWQETLGIIAVNKNISPLIAGYSTRLLADRKLLDGDELVRAFYYAMSSASGPAIAAAWLEGFLKGSGSFLLVDLDLWNIVNNWVALLDEDSFTDVLPLLRRTFAHFTQPERRKLGEKARQGGGPVLASVTTPEFDSERGRRGLPVILQLLALSPQTLNTPAHE